MKFILTFIVLLIFANITNAQLVNWSDPPIKVSYKEVPRLNTSNSAVPDDIKGLVWNKWETESFIILSIDPDQGRYLVENIEAIKYWILDRWGLNNITFSVKCKIIATPTAAMLKKLFNFNQSLGEVKRNAEGKIESSAVWLSLDKPLDNLLPAALTLPTLHEYRYQSKSNFGFWMFRAMTHLNRPALEIKQRLVDLDKLLANKQKSYSAKEILFMDEKAWLAAKPEDKAIFDRQAVALCLMLRKEMGQSNLIKFIHTSGNEAAMQEVYGYASFQELDYTLRRFMTYIAVDLRASRTPEEYLMITKGGGK